MRLTTALLGVCLLALPAAAEEWPGWRGPRGDGTSEEKGVPVHWGKSENVAWKTPIPGRGHSSPVVWGDRVFVTTCVEEEQKRLLLCLGRRDGKVLWQRAVLTAPLEGLHPLNSYASSTPATDGRHVWVTFLSGTDMLAACYDFDGHEVWKRLPGKFFSKHGFCCSPVLYKDLVILNGDHDGDGYLVALDKATGEPRWRTERPNKTRSYCAPLLAEAAGRKQLVLSGSKCVAGYDPDGGKLLWIIDGPTEQFVASLVYGDGLFFLTAGFPTYHYLAIRPDGAGDVTRTHVAWHHEPPKREGSYVPSPVFHDGYFFVVSDDGWANGFEAKSGRRVWLQRLGRHHSASPVCADGRLYFTADDGETFVLKASGKFELLGRNPLGEECYASPAVAHGQIFLRGLHHLSCIGN
jgi:outer membrane protein assembly factor BamB